MTQKNKQPAQFWNPLYEIHNPIAAQHTEVIYNVLRTLTFRDIVKSGGHITNDEITELARPMIFNFDYDFYEDEEKRKALETGILNHFMFDEIGQETYQYWHHELKHWMQINMPRYYTLFKTIPFQDQEDPTSNTNYKESYTRKTNSDTTAESEAGGKDKTTNLTSTTPQGRIDLESTNYVDAIAQAISEPGTTSKSSGTSDGTEVYEFQRKGNIGVQTMAQVLQGSRDAVITLENQLYEEMEEYGLFYYLL